MRQQTDPAYACVGCAMCNLVCPNNAIGPVRADEADKLRFHIDRGGQPRRRGGRRNVPGVLLDRLKFIRISMLTDPALDAGRHEFELRTLLGRVLPPEENLKHVRENGWIPPVREIYPLVIGGMSFGALSPEHVGGASDGGRLPERGARHAGAHVHRRGRLPAAAAALAVPQVRDPADRQRLLRLGRDPARPARDEGGPLRDRDQVRPGGQARATAAC